MSEGKMTEWQLFDSASRDGTAFLAYDPILGVIGAYYEVPDADDEWEEGFTFREFMGGDFLYNCEPSHWMPLPTPPTAEGRE